jgi:plasmid stabilization system protein ParE
MDCAVIYSEAALADLHQIIAKDNAKVAERFANRLVDLAESLRSLPERGRPVKKWPAVRVIVLAPYLIFYHFKRPATQVEILRFGMEREIRLAWSYDSLIRHGSPVAPLDMS